MITRLRIENYKAIKECDLKCGELNVLTGVNASGKSSFLQTLLLLRQSHENGSLAKNQPSLSLSGRDALIDVGTFKDILCSSASKGLEKIKLEASFETEGSINFVSQEYSPDNKDLNVLYPSQIIISGMATDLVGPNQLNILRDSFQYLSADRIQPKESYPRFTNSQSLGKKGEFTAHFLEKFGAMDLPIKELSYQDEPASFSIAYQVNQWLSEISENIEVMTRENLKTNEIELFYRYKNQDGTPTQDQKPQNVGFGITHTLPIVVAILAAKKGDLIIVENPESHLHPRAQSRLAHLFSIAAFNGVQLFVETHSDHIINGLRIAVKKGKIKPDQVFINYFSLNEAHLADSRRLKIDPDGGLEKWPKGFFDEWDNSIIQLMD